MKKLFLLDIKKLDENLEGIDRPVEKVLKRYELNIGDYETCEFSEAIFIRLGWSNKYKDTIFSFRTIFCKIIEIYSRNIELKLKNGKKIKYYFRNNTLEYEIGGKWKPEYSYTKAKLYKKAIDDEECILKELFNEIKEKDIYKKLEEVAKLLDSLSNFTPHPGYPFNQAKGCLSGVADSLNLMIDKVQACIDDGDGLEYDNKIIELSYNAIRDVKLTKKVKGIAKCYKLIIKTNRKNLKFFARPKENYFFGESDENDFYILENFYFFLKDKIEK